MEESVLDFLKREIDSTQVLCQMNHPDINRPGAQSVPCTRKARYTAMVHDCELAAANPGSGVKIPICADFIERAKTLNYPYRCTGCRTIVGHFVHLVWDIDPLHNPA